MNHPDRLDIQALTTRTGRTVVIRTVHDDMFHGASVEAVDDRSLRFSLSNDQADALVHALQNGGRLEIAGHVWNADDAIIHETAFPGLVESEPT